MTATERTESTCRPYLTGGSRMLEPFIGKPFAAGGHGPSAYDCWGLVHTAARELFGMQFPHAVYASLSLPHIAAAADDMLRTGAWRECMVADAGRVLALGGYDKSVRHVGLCLDGNRVLHITRLLHSCVMPVNKLTALYPVARFYQWVP